MVASGRAGGTSERPFLHRFRLAYDLDTTFTDPSGEIQDPENFQDYLVCQGQVKVSIAPKKKKE